MPRQTLWSHRKFRRLTRLLGERRSHVVGYLECMWAPAYECGDAYIGDAEDVAEAADYPGDPDTLVRALLDCGGEGQAGLIDELPDRPGHYQIHDLLDHAPDYVQRRRRREQARKGGRRARKADRSAHGQRTVTGRRTRAAKSVTDPTSQVRTQAQAHALAQDTVATARACSGRSAPASRSARRAESAVQTDHVYVRADEIAHDVARAYEACDYHGDDGAIIWQVVALLHAGLLSEHMVWDSVAATATCGQRNRMGYLRACLARHVAPRDLADLLRRVRCADGDWPTTRPTPLRVDGLAAIGAMPTVGRAIA